ncbi:DUF1254 domain-containing protein [Bdellovibrio sp. HCB185ZH]|uniref:DUF1254 domain-containing protein n=1 Tax=Bdellovibrio sp. HCB185ZH TaxID=3394235 RepID=UPI0039A5E764
MRLNQVVLTLLSSLLLSCANSQAGNNARATPTNGDGVKQIASDAYIYAYPMVVMATAREVMTAVPRAGREKAPLNQIANQRTLPGPDTNRPFAETDVLSSLSWLDVSKEPVVISLPDAGKRFVMFSLVSAWGEVFATPGTRTSGNQKKDFVLTGPDWKGAVPPNMQRIIAPTNSVWMVGRAHLKDKADFDRVYRYQDKIGVSTLSDFGSKAAKPMSVVFNIDVDNRTPIFDQVESMDARVFFEVFAKELKKNPPPQTDGAMVSRLAALGIFPDKEFNYDALPNNVKEGINSGYFAGQDQFADFQRGTPNLKMVNGWGMPILSGKYGTNYKARALMKKLGFDTTTPQDMSFARALVDVRGERLNGGFKYLLKFPKNQTPPVRGFWSVSLYNSRKFFVPNPLERYSLGSDHKLKANRDGSIDIYVQAVSPGKTLESNWLPSPAGEDFNLVMRMYWPNQSVIDGTWKIPALEKIPEFKNLSENLN